MLSTFVGSVDVPAAGVLIAMFIACAIVATTFLTVFTTKQETTNKFELAKLAQAAETSIKMEAIRSENQKELTKLAGMRDIEFKRIEHGMVDGTKEVHSVSRGESGG